MDGHAVFKALARRVKHFELIAEPGRNLNNITRNCSRVLLRAIVVIAREWPRIRHPTQNTVPGSSGFILCVASG
jgi:hypothetical protein